MMEPLHPYVRALICQVEAIGNHVLLPTSSFDEYELRAVAFVLRLAADRIDSAISIQDAFDELTGRASA